MTEYLGSRISLISKRDVRYVGTLIEINSEKSSVSLESVVSHGTEGRCPGAEIPAMDEVYGYIVFRGSDVKDLRIEGPPKPKENANPSVPNNDPAIMSSMRRPQSAAGKQRSPSPVPVGRSQFPSHEQGPEQNQSGWKGQQSEVQNELQGFQGQTQDRHQPFPPQNFPFGMPPRGRFPPGPYGPQGMQNHGFPGNNFGPPPPNWYPPYGMSPHMQGQFPPQQMQMGPPDEFGGAPGLPPKVPQSNEITSEPKNIVEKPTETKPSTPPAIGSKIPTPPVETKPTTTKTIQAAGDAKGGLTAGKNSRLIPAVPLTPTMPKSSIAINGMTKKPEIEVMQKDVPTSKAIEDANRDARAAVAAAMAKLHGASEKKPVENGTNGIEGITKGVGALRTHESRGRGRGQRGAHRGDRGDRGTRVEVPKTDFDFESSNAKFNKQDLVKEAIASGSPLGETASEEHLPDVTSPVPVTAGYNKTTSFFDNISSEIKDRAEGKEGIRGGREFRNEERAKNLETFGQGSVDSYRQNHRGRGRGRGRGGNRGRGRGGADRARGGGAATIAATQV